MGLDMYLTKKSSNKEVAYWRKANHIHNWFVKNCQDGKDDCKSHYVYTEKLKDLVDTCKKVLADHSLAEELLPTASGFFFGGTDYDKYYFETLKETINTLEHYINDEDGDFEYQSSW